MHLALCHCCLARLNSLPCWACTAIRLLCKVPASSSNLYPLSHGFLFLYTQEVYAGLVQLGSTYTTPSCTQTSCNCSMCWDVRCEQFAKYPCAKLKCGESFSALAVSRHMSSCPSPHHAPCRSQPLNAGGYGWELCCCTWPAASSSLSSSRRASGLSSCPSLSASHRYHYATCCCFSCSSLSSRSCVGLLCLPSMSALSVCCGRIVSCFTM